VKNYKTIIEKTVDNKLPFVYHENYDISFFGLEKMHPFDSKKYSAVFNYVTKALGFSQAHCYKPEMITEQALRKVHTQEYLDSLNTSATVARVTELAVLSWVPNFLLQRRLLTPMKLATAGTVLATELALQYGWAINLSGGYHHAKTGNGEGFCVYADIPLAVYTLFEKHPEIGKVLIVDLDAHQGNGFESIFKHDQRIAMFDIYNKDMYPHDFDAQQFITFDYPVSSGITDQEYLSIVHTKLPKAITDSKPKFIVYNAGTDIFARDPLGNMKVSAQGIIKRDEFVFRCAREKNIPIVMVLSGGYTPESAGIIGRSIVNLADQKLINVTLN